MFLYSVSRLGGSDGSSTEQAQVCLETLPRCCENHGQPKWLHVLYLIFNVLFNLQVNDIRARPSARCRHVELIFKDFVKVTSWLAERPPQTPAEAQTNKQDMRSQRDIYRHASPQWAGLWTAKPQINLSPVDHLLVCMCVCGCANRCVYICVHNTHKPIRVYSCLCYVHIFHRVHVCMCAPTYACVFLLECWHL